jgi:hypothetical protein
MNNLKPWRITANVPAVLKALIQKRVISEDYDSDAEYMLALILGDLICPIHHQLLPELLHKPRRVVDAFMERLATANVTGFDPRELGGWLEFRINELIENARATEFMRCVKIPEPPKLFQA